MASAPSARAAAPARPMPATAALILLFAMLAVDLGTDIAAAITDVGYRYTIDYGEGIVWQQMINIVAGRGYSPIGVFPAIVYHYPPVYHLTVAAFAALTGGDALAVGRMVSLGSAWGCALVVGLIAYHALAPYAASRGRRVGAAFAALFFAVCGPVAEWAPMMRVDMLACLFSLAGLGLSLAAWRRPRLILAAGLAFTLGVFTKQTAIAAPAAVIVGLLATRPRLGFACLATCLGLGLAGLAVAMIATDGGFLRHIVLYNINRSRFENLAMLIAPLRDHAVFLILAAIGAVAAIRRPRAGLTTAGQRAGGLILLLYLVFRTAMLATILKSGGSSNYLVEWFAPVAIFAAIGAAPAFAAALGEPPASSHPLRLPVPMAAALLIVAALQASTCVTLGVSPAAAAVQGRHLDRLVAAIRASDRPVIADDMTLLVRAGRPVLWEPSIAAELASVGRYDQPRFVAMIRRRCFAGFVTDGDRGNSTYDSRYNPPVQAAMDVFYPRRFLYRGLTLHLPPHGAALASCGMVR